MTQTEIAQEIKKLSLPEKLHLVEDMWDDIAANSSAVPVPDWQKKELNERTRDYQDGRISLAEWQTVHEEIRNRYK